LKLSGFDSSHSTMEHALSFQQDLPAPGLLDRLIHGRHNLIQGVPVTCRHTQCGLDTSGGDMAFSCFSAPFYLLRLMDVTVGRGGVGLQKVTSSGENNCTLHNQSLGMPRLILQKLLVLCTSTAEAHNPVQTAAGMVQ
jgi:hypothetical protein